MNYRIPTTDPPIEHDYIVLYGSFTFHVRAGSTRDACKKLGLWLNRCTVIMERW